MLTGVYAARNITGEQHDVWSVNTEKEYLEKGRTATLSHGDRLVPVPVTVRLREGSSKSTMRLSKPFLQA